MSMDPSPEAVAAKNRGNDRLDQGDLPGALEAYSEALRLEPAFADVYFNRAAVRMHLEDGRRRPR